MYDGTRISSPVKPHVKDKQGSDGGPKETNERKKISDRIGERENGCAIRVEREA